MPISPSLSSIFFSPTKKKPNKSIPFKDYYSKWFTTLKTTILPLLQASIASTSTTSSSSLSSSSQSLLTSHVHLLLHHLFSYYDTLDLLATTSPSTSLPLLLFPPWRNHLERPFLFLGDFHPYIFTNLIRSLLNDDDDEEEEEEEGGDLRGSLSRGRDAKRVAFNGSWKLADMAWKDPPEELLLKIDQIERGLRLMVPALTDRVHKAQTGFIKEVVKEWMAQDDHDHDRDDHKEVVGGGAGEAMKVEMEELAQVFLDANRLRRTVVSDIVGALSLFQGALFLEGLAQFLVGFHDPDLVRWFKKCKTPIGD